MRMQRVPINRPRSNRRYHRDHNTGGVTSSDRANTHLITNLAFSLRYLQDHSDFHDFHASQKEHGPSDRRHTNNRLNRTDVNAMVRTKNVNQIGRRRRINNKDDRSSGGHRKTRPFKLNSFTRRRRRRQPGRVRLRHRTRRPRVNREEERSNHLRVQRLTRSMRPVTNRRNTQRQVKGRFLRRTKDRRPDRPERRNGNHRRRQPWADGTTSRVSTVSGKPNTIRRIRCQAYNGGANSGRGRHRTGRSTLR